VAISRACGVNSRPECDRSVKSKGWAHELQVGMRTLLVIGLQGHSYYILGKNVLHFVQALRHAEF
jgi:hypothetical protein